MSLLRNLLRLGLVLLVLAGASTARAAFEPWGPLVDDSWVVINANDPKPVIHTVNAGDYAMGFDQAASGNRARGMNALCFSYGGSDTGYLASGALADSFSVRNLGNSRTFRDLLILVAINTPSLPSNFAMTLGASGQPAYAFNPLADFGYYDHPTWDTGRPSGFYSVTNPTGEGIAHDFATGMVTIYAAQNVNLAPNGGTATFDYSFSSLPGGIVFSVYGFDASIGWIYHTNRAVVDLNQATAPISTFEVIVPEPASLTIVVLGLALLRRRGRACLRRA